MAADRKSTIRRLSLKDAELEVLRLATPVIENSGNDEWNLRVLGVKPHRHDPNCVGKTPARWTVHVQGVPCNEPDAVIDGADGFLIVDLVDGSVNWE